jgi:glutamyl-tRNA synthetase
LSNSDLAARTKPFFIKAGFAVNDDLLLRVSPLIRERLVTLDDCVAFAGFFFKDNVEPVPAELIAKGLDARQSAGVARKAYEILSALPDLNHPTAEPPMRAYVEQSGLSANQVFGILRVAITGQKVSPPLFESIEAIGREKSLQRLKKAIEILERM